MSARAAGAAAWSLPLAFGGERFALRAADPRWQAVLAARYGPFAVPFAPARCRGEAAPGSAAPPVAVELVTTAEAPRDWPALERLLAEPAPVACRGSEVRLAAPSYDVRVDLGRRRARVAGPLHRAPLDQLFRVALPLLLAADGLVLHGALLVAGGRGWLCCGPSGCGKSTLASVLPAQARCDELAAVRRQAGRWAAWSLPYWHGRPAVVELAGIRLLRHGERHQLRPLTPAEALRALCHEVQWPAVAAATDLALASLAALVAAVPVAELAFRPSADVWDVLAADPAPPGEAGS